MDIDPVLLARLQFAANISFHIMFPAITIALGWILLFFKLRHNRTGDQKWLDNYFFFTKAFALTFGLGVVSGVTMSFQFGTNWPGFMESVGNIAGPLLGFEVLTAFFLEATFLGIMLYGYRRVPRWLHTLATFLVAIGTTASAFWILVLNSWMQTPVGFEMIDGEAFPTDWWAIIFNPSFPYRFFHMLIASGLTAAFFVAGLSALRWFFGRRDAVTLTGAKTGVFLAAILIPIQIYVGDLHGLNTKEHQPAKVAAMEGLWHTEAGAPLVLFGIPNSQTQTNDYAIEIPKLASLILTHELDGEVKGLNEFDHHPPVGPVFWAFRVMVGMGLLMLIVSWFASFKLRRKQHILPSVLYLLLPMTFAGWIATLAGWYVTEIGRQPFLVYGVLTTEEAASAIPSPILGISLTAYLSIYAVLLLAYFGTLIHMARPGKDEGTSDNNAEHRRAANVEIAEEVV